MVFLGCGWFSWIACLQQAWEYLGGNWNSLCPSALCSGLFGSHCRTRDGHVQFWTAPRVLSSLKHLCRKALRTFLTTYQVLALPIPRKLKEFLTYRTF